MPLTPEQEDIIRDAAKANGDDPEEIIAELNRQLDSDPEDPTPGKNDAAAGAESTGAESGAKAHGGRGYFAYEYPFLTVNEIRASLFLEPIADGDLYSNEWLAAHSGGSNASAPADTTTPEG